MKNKILLIIFIGLTITSYAQINLVKNPGLESYWRCPNVWNEIKFANYWTSLGDTISASIDSLGGLFCTPEYCNTCAGSNPYCGVPTDGLYYYHYPHSGNGMAQVMMFCDTTFNLADSTLFGGDVYYQRDYLQGRLYMKLQKDKAYCVSFYVVLEHFSAYAINHIGAYFDDGTIDTTNWCGLVQTTHTPQVYENEIITDTLNWTKVQGSFISNGTENFITIGNFFDSAHTDKIREYFYWAIGGMNDLNTFYLVDDMSVIAMDAHADAGPDKWVSPGSDSVWVGDTTGYLPCYWYANGVLIDSNIAGLKVLPTVNTSYTMVLDVCGNITSDTAVVFVAPVGIAIDFHGGLMDVILYPNPAKSILNLEGAEMCQVTILDMYSKEVLELKPDPNTKKLINISGLQSGVYNIVVNDPITGYKIVKKFIKE